MLSKFFQNPLKIEPSIKIDTHKDIIYLPPISQKKQKNLNVLMRKTCV
jgi:hypothetical protein